MKTVSLWPKTYTCWSQDRVLFASIPFTWSVPLFLKQLDRERALWRGTVVGGPGALLVKHFYPDLFGTAAVPVVVGTYYPGVLQRVDSQATRTSTGCVHHCAFCAIGQQIVEPGGFVELPDWPDRSTLVDNNLFAASQSHFDRVMDRLEHHSAPDFEQGLDPRLLTEYHAQRLSRLRNPVIRLALDSKAVYEAWSKAFDLLRRFAVAKHRIRSYALAGFTTGVDEAWERCLWIEKHGIKPLPMWFHRLDALKHNVVTEEQAALGWNDYERRRIMQWFYQHKKAVFRA